MDSFLGIPVEERTSTGSKILNWEAVSGDILITISARKNKDNIFNYIVCVDLCGYPEKWWPGPKFKIAESSGDNIKFVELDIKRQLKRLQVGKY